MSSVMMRPTFQYRLTIDRFAATATCSRAESINCRISDSAHRPPETDGALVCFFTFCRFALLILITWLFYVDAYPFFTRCCGRRRKFAALPRPKLLIPWGIRG